MGEHKLLYLLAYLLTDAEQANLYVHLAAVCWVPVKMKADSGDF